MADINDVLQIARVFKSQAEADLVKDTYSKVLPINMISFCNAVKEVLKEQQAEIKALREEKEKTESNFAEYVDEKREEVEELNAKIKRMKFELKKYEELVSVLKNKA